MNNCQTDTKKWLLMSLVCGFAANGAYFVSTMVSISPRINYLIFLAFGPLLIASMVGLYHYLKEEGDSACLQLGILGTIIAGALVTLMMAMQASLRIYFDGIPHDGSVSEATRVAWDMSLMAGDALQLGADMAWDIFLFAGLMLLGLVYVRHPRLGPIYGWPMALLGLSGLVLNAWTFPTPPREAELFDVGPLVGLWCGIVSIRFIVIYAGMVRNRAGSVETE